MPKSDLKIHHKRFIVKMLAVYESPDDVIEAVREKFKITVTKVQLRHYDPTKVDGADLAKDLKKLFEETRKAFENAEVVPLSKRVVRIKKLSNYVERFESMGNFGKAAELIEQIAKDEGNMFTNRKEIGGIGGGAVLVHSKTLDEWKNDAEQRTSQAVSVFEMFEEDGQEEEKPS